MMKLLKIFPLVVLCVLSPAAMAGKNVIEDGGVGMSLAELEYIVRHWTPEMQAAAANDLGDRLELLNLALSNKRIAAEVDKLTPEKDGDVYWRAELMKRATMRKLVVELYLREAEVPDMTELARERYLTQRDKFAKVPDQRLSSHILFKCDVKQACDQQAVSERAQAVLAELQAGASPLRNWPGSTARTSAPVPRAASTIAG